MSAIIPRVMEHTRHVARIVQHHCGKVQEKLDRTLQIANTQPKAVLYSGLLAIVCVWFCVTIARRIRYRKRQFITPPSTPNLEKRTLFKAPDRPPGGKCTPPVL